MNDADQFNDSIKSNRFLFSAAKDQRENGRNNRSSVMSEIDSNFTPKYSNECLHMEFQNYNSHSTKDNGEMKRNCYRTEGKQRNEEMERIKSFHYATLFISTILVPNHSDGRCIEIEPLNIHQHHIS